MIAPSIPVLHLQAGVEWQAQAARVLAASPDIHCHHMPSSSVQFSSPSGRLLAKAINNPHYTEKFPCAKANPSISSQRSCQKLIWLITKSSFVSLACLTRRRQQNPQFTATHPLNHRFQGFIYNEIIDLQFCSCTRFPRCLRTGPAPKHTFHHLQRTTRGLHSLQTQQTQSYSLLFNTHYT